MRINWTINYKLTTNTTINMKQYIEYLEKKIEDCQSLNMPLEKYAFQKALETYRMMRTEEKESKVKVLLAGSDFSHSKEIARAHSIHPFEPERGISINEAMLDNIGIRLTAMPKMTEPLIPLDKYGKPLELPKSKFHK